MKMDIPVVELNWLPDEEWNKRATEANRKAFIKEFGREPAEGEANEWVRSFCKEDDEKNPVEVYSDENMVIKRL